MGGLVAGAIASLTNIGLHTVALGIIFYVCMLWGMALISLVLNGPWRGPYLVKRKRFLIVFTIVHIVANGLIAVVHGLEFFGNQYTTGDLSSAYSFLRIPTTRFGILYAIIAFPLGTVGDWFNRRVLIGSLGLIFVVFNSVLWAWLVWCSGRKVAPRLFKGEFRVKKAERIED